MNEIRKQALGRGLSSLLGESHEEEQKGVFSSFQHIPLTSIEPGVNQPRHSFSEADILSLSISIKEKGLLQPILLRYHPHKKDAYEIVAGERRWRAAKLIDMGFIPAIVRGFSDEEALEVGLLENLQRQDLDPIDEASGYRRLAEEFGHTQESLSRIVGKSRSHIANTLRLLTLPENVQTYLKSRQLSAGHGRALLGAKDPELLAAMILEKNLSVRQAETLAKKSHQQETSSYQEPILDPEVEILTEQLCNLLGVDVHLILKGEGGKIIIPFEDPVELDQIIGKFNLLGMTG